MSKFSKKSNGGLVYSTNPDAFTNSEPDEVRPTIDPGQQQLRVRIETKHRGGKVVTIVNGFEGNSEDLNQLAKVLKTKCGTGGSTKDGEIIIQGRYQEKIILLLKELGYSKTK